MVVSPIMLQLKDLSKLSTTDYNRSSIFLMGAIPTDIVINVQLFTPEDIVIYSLCMIALLVSLCCSIYCVFQTSKAVIKPLSQLNMRMTEILHDDINAVSLDNGDAEGKCADIKRLQEKFSDLISDYKFTQNDFMKQESEVIALIDLAEACVLFSG